MSNKLTSGYCPVAGEWYPALEIPRPAVYFEFARQDIIKERYPDLVVDYAGSPEEIAAAIKNSVDDVVEVMINKDFEVALTEAGEIRTIQVPAGKTLIVDLNGHTIKNVAYLFCVLGELVINDSKGTGAMVATYKGEEAAYPAIYVSGEGASVTLNGGTLQTFPEDLGDDEVCYTYGVYAANSSSVYVGGKAKIVTAHAAALSTNGTASSGSGNFYVAGDAVLTATKSSFSIYMPNQEKVVIKENAILNGGICARQGQIDISGNAKLNKSPYSATTTIVDFIKQGNNGYVDTDNVVVLLTGTYENTVNEEFGNSMNVKISGNATINSNVDTQPIAIATLNTGSDQTVKVDFASEANIGGGYMVYDQELLAAEAADKGYTYNPKATTDLTVKVAGEVVYPVVTGTGQDPIVEPEEQP